jgi:hypothetical protein
MKKSIMIFESSTIAGGVNGILKQNFYLDQVFGSCHQALEPVIMQYLHTNNIVRILSVENTSNTTLFSTLMYFINPYPYDY